MTKLSKIIKDLKKYDNIDIPYKHAEQLFKYLDLKTNNCDLITKMDIDNIFESSEPNIEWSQIKYIVIYATDDDDSLPTIHNEFKDKYHEPIEINNEYSLMGDVYDDNLASKIYELSPNIYDLFEEDGADLLMECFSGELLDFLKENDIEIVGRSDCYTYDFKSKNKLVVSEF